MSRPAVSPSSHTRGRGRPGRLVAMLGTLLVLLVLLVPVTADTRSPSPSMGPVPALPSVFGDLGTGGDAAIRWTGDGAGEPGRGREPFGRFSSGSSLDDIAVELGLDWGALVGDRGYVQGPSAGSGYTIDAILDPAIEPAAWQAAFRQQARFGWDQLETAVGPAVLTHDGLLRYAGDGIAVEVRGFPLSPDEVVPFIEQLPPAGPRATVPAEVIERGRVLGGWIPPVRLTWEGNALRKDGAPIAPRALDALLPDSDFTRIADDLCLDEGAVPGFVVRTRFLTPQRPARWMLVAELLDPSGDASRWLPPLRAVLANTEAPDGGLEFRETDVGSLAGRPGAVFDRRDDSGSAAIVVSGPAVTLFAGSTDDVEAALASYPFAEPVAPRSVPRTTGRCFTSP